ncbi:MAG: DUF1254 domain-containing protein [Pseudomonadota bacterium]
MRTALAFTLGAALLSSNALAEPIVVTEENFAQAYTNLRFQRIIEAAGGLNTFLTMPVPSSDPAKQFVVRMNRDTAYSTSVFDLSSRQVYITIPETDQYVTIQIIDENHETQRMIYGPGRYNVTAKTDFAFIIVRTLDPDIREKIVVEAPAPKDFVVQDWEMESFAEVEAKGNADFSDGYHQATAYGNQEAGQTAYMNYVGAAGGWGGAMVHDNIYQTSPYFDADGCYETTFKDPKAEYFWSATVYNGDGYMFNDVANISSEMDPVQNEDGTYTLRFGCDGQPNNIPTLEGNTTGKFNVLMRHYGPSEMVSNFEFGYNMTQFIRTVE